MNPQNRDLDNQAVAQLTRAARLDLAPEHLVVLAPAAQAVYGLIDRLDTVELGETPPATAFDARRR